MKFTWKCEERVQYGKGGDIAASFKWLHIPAGQLLAAEAHELIQHLPCPELEMEPVFDLAAEEGWYAIGKEGIEKIWYCRKEPPSFIAVPVQET